MQSLWSGLIQASLGLGIVAIAAFLQVVDFKEAGDFLREFGFPITCFMLVVIASGRGDIVWRKSHESEIKSLKESHIAEINGLKDQITQIVRERDRLFEITVPAVRAVESGANALHEIQKSNER